MRTGGIFLKKKTKTLLTALAVPLGVGAVSGFLTQGSMDTFEKLKQPPLTPPGWVFPVVWTGLFAMMGTASYLIARLPESEEKKAWTVKNDPRVTPIGKFMRHTSIDELPQLFNILKGNMSLVGPRPERPFFVEKFREEIPRYMVKHQVRPGLTGWAQVNGYRGDTSIRKRIEYDLYYIENWSIGLDIKIIFLTFFKGFINKNAY